VVSQVFVESKPVRQRETTTPSTRVEELKVPRATVVFSETEDFKLKSCEGGIITLRRMSYGQKLARQEQAVKMTMKQEARGSKSGEMSMDMLQHAATLFDFRACIVDHNLEDENGQKLNLTNYADMDRLDPRIGEEIADHINRMNNFEDDLAESGFPKGSEPQS